ncbi:hypothetical protein SGFS_023730 [Streptomyces graminofaciens]|uniref:TetR family transcriptional regulator n=1 Tax=Streptomyces graminofaciens TaxID=68212 RepID=A0ABN5VD03_9ACTN|nr:hypothetical protein SGFS_023730 [Streptomyces graminofaciens]
MQEAGVEGDHDMLAHALLAFPSFEVTDYLHKEREVPVTRLQATWVDMVRRMTRPGGG